MTTSNICVFEQIIYRTTPEGIPWEIYEAISSGPVAGGTCPFHLKDQLYRNLPVTLEVLNESQNLSLRINHVGMIV